MQYTFSILIMDLWNRKKHTQNTWINLLDSSEGQDSALARPGQVQSENMWLESLQINKCAQTWASTNLARRSHVNTCPDISIYLSNLPGNTKYQEIPPIHVMRSQFQPFDIVLFASLYILNLALCRHLKIILSSSWGVSDWVSVEQSPGTARLCQTLEPLGPAGQRCDMVGGHTSIYHNKTLD